MKKILLSSFLVITFLAYVVSQRFENDEQGEAHIPVVTSPAPVYVVQPSSSPISSTLPKNVGSITTSPSPIAKTGQFNDGTYVGDSVDVFYGNVQVQAVVQGGKLVDVKFLDFPHDRNTSEEISNYSMPLLRSEAIQAQSAHVDIVSGATQTSKGFQQSLQSALQKAI